MFDKGSIGRQVAIGVAVFVIGSLIVHQLRQQTQLVDDDDGSPGLDG